MNESGFRSYFRKHNTGFTLMEPLPTYESAVVAREHVEKLLTDHPDMCGMFISGGGVTGAIAALRATPKRADFVVVGYEIFDDTRAALIDGTFSLIIAHPIERFARETVATLVKAKTAGPGAGLTGSPSGSTCIAPKAFDHLQLPGRHFASRVCKYDLLVCEVPCGFRPFCAQQNNQVRSRLGAVNYCGHSKPQQRWAAFRPLRRCRCYCEPKRSIEANGSKIRMADVAPQKMLRHS